MTPGKTASIQHHRITLFTSSNTRHLTQRVTNRPSCPLRRGRDIPLLCNIYLYRLDRAWDADQHGLLVRYCDDLVVMCATRQQAGAALERLTGLLAGLGLEPKQARLPTSAMRTVPATALSTSAPALAASPCPPCRRCSPGAAACTTRPAPRSCRARRSASDHGRPLAAGFTAFLAPAGNG